MQKSPFSGTAEGASTAICISSVSLFGAAEASLLALSVTFGVLAGLSARALLKSSAMKDILATLLSLSAALAAANAAAAFLGLSELPRGVFSACAVAAVFILCRAGEGRGTLGGALVYSVAAVLAGAFAETLGLGQIFGMRLPVDDGGVAAVFTTPAGGMMTSAVAAAVTKYIMKKSEAVRSECKR